MLFRSRIGKCARENPNEPKPKCLSKEKASQLRSQGGAKKIASAVKRKRKEDPVANRRGKGEKPKMVSNKINEQSEMVRYCPKCQKDETRDECKYGPKYWDMFSLPIKVGNVYDPNKPHPGNFPEQFSFGHGEGKGVTLIAVVESCNRPGCVEPT